MCGSSITNQQRTKKPLAKGLHGVSARRVICVVTARAHETDRVNWGWGTNESERVHMYCTIFQDFACFERMLLLDAGNICTECVRVDKVRMMAVHERILAKGVPFLGPKHRPLTANSSCNYADTAFAHQHNYIISITVRVCVAPHLCASITAPPFMQNLGRLSV